MSGYLYFLKTRGEQFSIIDYKAKTKSRIHTLLIPYLAWNVFQIVFWIITAYLKDGSPAEAIISSETLPHLFWDYHHWGKTYTAPVLLAAWFIRDLIIVCLASPAIWWLMTKSKGWILLIFGFFYVTAWPSINGLPITAVFWFSFGSLFSIRKLNFVDVFRRFKWLSIVVSMISFVILLTSWKKYQDSCWPTIIYGSYILSTAISVVCIVANQIERGTLRLSSGLGDATYFIYLAHPFLLGFTVRLMKLFSLEGIPAWLLGVTLIVVVLLCAYAFLRRYIPWTLRLLLGQK